MKFALPLAFSDPEQALPLARAADGSGWDLVCVSDHVVHPEHIRSRYPYTESGEPRWDADTSWPDPWVTISAMAAVTERLRFCTNVFVLPLRNPFLVAKSVSTAALLSGGRVSLGIGMGWMEDEFELMEQPFRRRGARADEMIGILRKLWTGEMVDHQGEFYRFPRLRMLPAPPAPIPIWVGGTSEAALRRVGRLGDGWISDLHPVDEIRDLVERIRRHRREAGRGDAPLEIVAAATDAVGVDGYRRMGAAGVTTVLTLPWIFYGGPTEDLERKCDGIRRFAGDVFPHLR